VASNKPEKIAVENVIRPGRVRSVDATKYRAMRRAFLKRASQHIAGIDGGRSPRTSDRPSARETVSGRSEGRLVVKDSSARS
jgi:hypothetical protein